MIKMAASVSLPLAARRHAVPPSIIPPPSQPGFVSTEVFKNVCNKLSTSSSAVVLTGFSGTGKTFLAQKVSATFWEKHESEDKIYRLFNCESIETLYNDLQLFYQDLNIKQDALKELQLHKWSVLRKFYKDMENYFAGCLKIFIFDDAERDEELLQEINTICREVESGKSSNWKVLVTAQKTNSSADGYRKIGKENFIHLTGFTLNEAKDLFKGCEIDEATIKKLAEKLGYLPLALRICKKDLLSDESEDDRSKFVDKYLQQIEKETSELQNPSRDNSVLIAIKICIDRLLGDLRYSEESGNLIKMLRFYSEKSITLDLIYSCAEMVIPDAEKAKRMAQKLISRLIEKDICTKRSEHGVRLYDLHKLVRSSLKLFVGETEKLNIFRDALVAFVKVIPKDGRKHQTRLQGFYAEHGEELHKEITELFREIQNSNTTADIDRQYLMFLHCNLLLGVGYCLCSQASSLIFGIQRIEEARDKYCHLVHGPGTNYQSLRERINVEEAEADKEIAKALYVRGKALEMVNHCENYKRYVRQLPQYHRLTKKDLKNLLEIFKEEDLDHDLINDHLTERKLAELKNAQERRSVIDEKTLASVTMGELLAEIFCVHSSMSEKMVNDASDRERCVHLAEVAVEICSEIFNDSGVYLLAAVITERNALTNKMHHVQSAENFEQLIAKFEELSKVGRRDGKRLAYEAGLLRSDMSKDKYHELLCQESILICNGYLHELYHNTDDRYYMEGTRLLKTIEHLVNEQVYKCSARSFAYRKYSMFLYKCKKYDEATLYTIQAMENLHRYLTEENPDHNSTASANGNGSSGHPEFDHYRFSRLYDDIEKYYSEFKSSKRPNEKLMNISMREAVYLDKAIKYWRSVGDGRQPAGDNTKFKCLEKIVDNEVETMTSPIDQPQQC